MAADLSPLRLLLVTLAGWVNRHQQQVIEYLAEENRVLRGQLTERRVRLTDDQRRRLAAKGQRLGRRVLRQVATIVTPYTILRWHRRLIAGKWTFERKRPGRPGIMKEVSSLILRMATENPAWGYSRIQGALKNLDHRVARSTVAKVLKDNGIPPAPGRPSSWRTFMCALGRDCRCRLLHDGSVDCSRVGDLLHAVRAGSQEPAGTDRGLDAESRCRIHGPGRAAAHGRGRWLLGAPSRADL